MATREENKQRRRAQIRDATRELLREFEIDKITVEQVAARADVAPATVYNLIGVREELFSSLLDDLIEQMAAELTALPADDPIGYGHHIVTRSAELFTSDPAVYRQLVSTTIDYRNERKGSSIDPATWQAHAVRQAQALGVLDPDVDPDVIGLQILLGWEGAMYDWARQRLNDEAFTLHALQGYYLTVAALATPGHRGALQAALAEVHQQLRSLPPTANLLHRKGGP